MTGNKHRRSVTDRARRRAIRAHAARLGVPYSVAARLLVTQTGQSNGDVANGFSIGDDKHRAWLFAMRERRSFALRLQDTRLAADLPLGRAAHLTERFPPLRGMGAGPLYDGEGRQATLAMLYAVLGHESPALLPTADQLDWVAGLGEEAAVDFVCTALDRAARLLLDEDHWRLCTRVEAALIAGEAGSNRRTCDAARTLAQEFRTMIPSRSLLGARNTLDALLVATHGGHPPGTQVRILTGPWLGQTATVVGARWTRHGPPTHYEVSTGAIPTVLTFDHDNVVRHDRPESALTNSRRPI